MFHSFKPTKRSGIRWTYEERLKMALELFEKENKRREEGLADTPRIKRKKKTEEREPYVVQKKKINYKHCTK